MGAFMTGFQKQSVRLLGTAGAAALIAGSAIAQDISAAEAKVETLAERGGYLAGDKHNHSTCSDGAMAVQTVVSESLTTYGLDWFAQTGHGGSFDRDCRFSDPEYDGSETGSGAFWVDTVGEENIKGDKNEGRMWRWQILNEFSYDLQRSARDLAGKAAWLGIEHNAPGHEHVSMAILDGQFDTPGHSYHTGQFDYLFDRNDRDTSGGEENDFENPANRGIPKPGVIDGVFDSEAVTGLAGRNVSVSAVRWLAENFGDSAYYVPAHVERQGGFVSDDNRGWNVEDLRELYDAGLLTEGHAAGTSIVFGGELLPGHQFASGGRGSYKVSRPSSGFGTYGGAGAYIGAEVSRAGFDFDGETAITNARLTEIRDEFNALFDNRLTQPSGADQYDQLNACADCEDAAPEGVSTSSREQFVLGRPGLATMWDALLGEGRKFFAFTSSDWHNRGAFGPFEPQSTLDPWPGEYNKVYAYAHAESAPTLAASQSIVDGMRNGNAFAVLGDLIDEFYFVMCQGSRCATMGEELVVHDYGGDVVWYVKLRDPAGTNFSPYTFSNPSLLQLGINIPMNEPVLDHIDIIRGEISGMIEPTDPEFSNNVSNPTVELFGRVYRADFTTDGEYLIASGTIPDSDFSTDQYFRIRGTNMPVGTPNETDADGNPLLDDYSALIPCTAEPEQAPTAIELDPRFSPFFKSREATGGRGGGAPGALFDPTACPEHLPVDENGVKYLDADVEAWADLWFYANPIFVNVK